MATKKIINSIKVENIVDFDKFLYINSDGDIIAKGNDIKTIDILSHPTALLHKPSSVIHTYKVSDFVLDNNESAETIRKIYVKIISKRSNSKRLVFKNSYPFAIDDLITTFYSIRSQRNNSQQHGTGIETIVEIPVNRNQEYFKISLIANTSKSSFELIAASCLL